MHIEPWVLEILACPDCRAPLRVEEAAAELVCTGCGLAYPVRDDIPVLLIDEARRPGAARAEAPGPGAPGPGAPGASADVPLPAAP